MGPIPMPKNADADKTDDEVHMSSVPKVSGGNMPVAFRPANFKPKYLDEYTGAVLDPKLIREAIELNYFNAKVWHLSTVEEMETFPDHILVRSRWVLCNKDDETSPDVRARLVSCELNNGTKNIYLLPPLHRWKPNV